MKRHRIVGVVAVLSTSVIAAESSNNECLTEAQRSALFSRQLEAVGTPAIELGSRLRAVREATATHDKSRKALALCEVERSPSNPEACAREQTSHQAAFDALAAATAEHARAREELKQKAAEVFRAVRAEFPSCGNIDR
jgi:hypothetical protein